VEGEILEKRKRELTIREQFVGGSCGYAQNDNFSTTSCPEKFLIPFFFKFFEELLHFLSFSEMAFSSSQNNFNLNVVPYAQQEIWRPSFLSEKVISRLMTL
jgi:hypothetical protein